MKQRSILAIVIIAPLALALTACGGPQQSQQTLELLKNPLYTERFSEEMVDTMVNLEIYEDPLLVDEAKQRLVQQTNSDWLEKAREARRLQREGMIGTMLPMEQYAAGEVLYLKNTVHFSTLFETEPGPSLHVFITTVVDPRDVEFPDETAIDLGPLQSPYGAQSYAFTPIEDPSLYRTVVLWDTELERLYGFAQVAKI